MFSDGKCVCTPQCYCCVFHSFFPPCAQIRLSIPLFCSPGRTSWRLRPFVQSQSSACSTSKSHLGGGLSLRRGLLWMYYKNGILGRQFGNAAISPQWLLEVLQPKIPCGSKSIFPHSIKINSNRTTFDLNGINKSFCCIFSSPGLLIFQ